MNAEPWLDALLQGLWQAHLGLSLGLLAVALLRRPLRRIAGAQEAYALWMLPLLCMACTALPETGLPRLQLAPVVWQTARSSLEAGTHAAAVPTPAALLLWALGALLVTAWHGLQHWRFLRALPMDPQACLRTPRGSSPGLVGVWQPRLLLPLDFEERFTPQERAWVLAHEAMHARRHDNATRLLAALLQALAWFNPLLWWALPALRQDQELACDAALLRHRPGQWKRYAQALLKTDPQFAFPAVPIAASAWQPTHPLKERIAMLKSVSQLPLWRRRFGRLALCAAALLATAGVQALRAGPAQAQPALPPLTASQACPQTQRPVIPDLELKGQFSLTALFEINAKGEPANIRVAGEPQLREPVREAISRYVCTPPKGGLEVEQHFVFTFD